MIYKKIRIHNSIIMQILLLIFTTYFYLGDLSVVKKVSPLEKNPSYWATNAKKQIDLKLVEKPIKNIAKNIILAIGDGMGISTITSTRCYKNQQMKNAQFPDQNLYFENFPNVGLSKTYSVDRYVADSAATATAILTGIKTNNGVIGLSPDVQYRNCSTYISKNQKLKNIAEMFFETGKSVGFVTTSSILDATPASMFASTPSRRWQYKEIKNCLAKDIAVQFLENSEKFQVVMGGGRRYFLPKNYTEPEYPHKTVGVRKDKRNLLNEWKEKMNKKSKDGAFYISNSTQIDLINKKSVKHLLGLFDYNHLNFNDQRNNEPTLEQMTKTAIEILSRNPLGFFLLIEGANIDKAHHRNMAMRAIIETLELEKAVHLADKMTNTKDTLLIVTADHSHTLSLGSYVSRETDITGINVGYTDQVLDKKGHTSLLYSNGPGYKVPRENITVKTNFTPDFVYNSGVPLAFASHGGEEVSVYSKGPWGHLLKDIYEQSYIGNVMMYASCNGIYSERQHCNGSDSLPKLPVMLIIILSVIKFYLNL